MCMGITRNKNSNYASIINLEGRRHLFWYVVSVPLLTKKRAHNQYKVPNRYWPVEYYDRMSKYLCAVIIPKGTFISPQA